MSNDPTVQVGELNPLLFLSEQLIHLEGSKSFGSSAHVSDDDGSPPPTANTFEPMYDNTTITSNHHTQAMERLEEYEFDQTASSPNMEEDEEGEKVQGDDSARREWNVKQTSDSTDIGSMVHKAKRAAASLWMVLHAQECRFGGDKCPFHGCLETKILLLHVKNCPSKADHSPCPEQFQGCTQARKLLNHYRRCRDIRALKRNSFSSTHASHSCLICSLLARHARNVLESTAAASTLASIGLTTTTSPISSISMPPPPPRPRTCSLGSIPQPQKPTLLGSTALAQNVPLPQNSFSFSSTNNFLGKSSQVRSTINHIKPTPSYGRPRATSLDERNSVFSSSKIKGQAWTQSPSSRHREHDPTLEFGILEQVNKEPMLPCIEEVESVHRLG